MLVRDPDRPRSMPDRSVLTTSKETALAAADVVVELLGGTGLAVELMLQALREGRRVVTGNKAALAEHWDEFLPYLLQGQLYFEAAVMAGTPAIAPLVGVLRGSEPLQLDAVLNGTCSFIIGRLEQGSPFDEAVAEAQKLGYAEADPSLDIGGIDAAHKLAILARLAFDPLLGWEQVKASTKGIEELTPRMVTEAMEDGGSVTLLCSILPSGGSWRTLVRPVYLPPSHRLSQLTPDQNGFLFRGRQSGDVLLSGPGAGGESTASAVLADLQLLLAGVRGPVPLEQAAPVPDDWRAPPPAELRSA